MRLGPMSLLDYKCKVLQRLSIILILLLLIWVMLDFEDPPKEYEFNIWTGDKVRVQYYGEGDLIPESGGFKAGDVRGEFLIGATAQFDIVNTKGESLAGNDIYYLDDDYQYIGLINEDIGIGLSSKEDFREDIEEIKFIVEETGYGI